MDRSSTGSPDQESTLSGEVNGVLSEYNDPEAFSVLEAPAPAPDSASEDSGSRPETPTRDLAGETEPSARWPRGAEGVAGGVPELEEEPHPADRGPGRPLSPCPEQGHSAEVCEVGGLEPEGPQGPFSEAPLLDSPPVPSSPSWAPRAERWLPATRADGGREEQGFLAHAGASGHLGSTPWHAVTDSDTGRKTGADSEGDLETAGAGPSPRASAWGASTHEQPARDQVVTSSDEEDIYAQGLPSSSSETSVAELGAGRSLQDLSRPGPEDPGLLKSDQVCGLLSSGKSLANSLFFFLRKKIFLPQSL